jgi:hypothetical protein
MGFAVGVILMFLISERRNEIKRSNLVIGGMHGPPEVIGAMVCDSIAKSPIDNWDAVIGNKEARQRGARYVERNLALAFGDANLNSKVYEEHRAAQLIELSKDRKLVLDIHDLPGDSGIDFAAIGDKGNPQILGVAALLNITNILVYKTRTYLMAHEPNALLVELGRGYDGELIRPNIQRLRECMNKITVSGLPVSVNLDNFNYFERVDEIATKEAKEIALSPVRIEPFEPIPPEILKALQRPGRDLSSGEYVAGYWNGRSSSADWFGEILKRVSNPFEKSDYGHILASTLNNETISL